MDRESPEIQELLSAVESMEQGQGSIFGFKLPVQRKEI